MSDKCNVFFIIYLFCFFVFKYLINCCIYFWNKVLGYACGHSHQLLQVGLWLNVNVANEHLLLAGIPKRRKNGHKNMQCDGDKILWWWGWGGGEYISLVQTEFFFVFSPPFICIFCFIQNILHLLLICFLTRAQIRRSCVSLRARGDRFSPEFFIFFNFTSPSLHSFKHTLV